MEELSPKEATQEKIMYAAVQWIRVGAAIALAVHTIDGCKEMEAGVKFGRKPFAKRSARRRNRANRGFGQGGTSVVVAPLQFSAVCLGGVPP